MSIDAFLFWVLVGFFAFNIGVRVWRQARAARGNSHEPLNESFERHRSESEDRAA